MEEWLFIAGGWELKDRELMFQLYGGIPETTAGVLASSSE